MKKTTEGFFSLSLSCSLCPIDTYYMDRESRGGVQCRAPDGSFGERGETMGAAAAAAAALCLARAIGLGRK